jgi:protocatechuate 3,4-dioxygenase beta subunit
VSKPWLAVPVTLLLMFAVAAGAQSKQEKKREAQLRTLHGSVLDTSENPVATGVVYLKNMKSLVIWTRITDDSGQYRFSGLDPNVDYEIHAEHNETMSATHTISNFDDRKDISLTLKLNKKKS